MNSRELSNNELCFICNEFMPCRNNLSVTTGCSETSIISFLESFIDQSNDQSAGLMSEAAVCQCCMNKLNEYDAYLTKANQVKNELIITYKSAHDPSRSETLQSDLSSSFQLTEPFPEVDFALNKTTNATVQQLQYNEEVSEEFRNLLEREGIKYDIEVFKRAFGDEETATVERKTQKVQNSRSKRLVGSLTCDFCAMKGFKNRQAFTSHLKTHRKEDPFFCDLCKTSFKSSNGLKIHLISNHGSIKHDIPCPFANCHKSFVNTTSLRAHFICHNKVGMNPSFVCDTCGKGFHYKLSFTQHLKAHSGIRDKQCELCGFKAISSNHLQRHVRARHTKEKNHVCSYCNRAFSERYNMMSHVRKQHLEPKPQKELSQTFYKCNFCCMEYSDDFKLQQHLKLSHHYFLGVQCEDFCVT